MTLMNLDWPTKNEDRPGSFVLVAAAYNNENYLWEELMTWLSDVGPLDDIETYWFDNFGRRELRVSGMSRQ